MMNALTIEPSVLRIPFKQSFRHASADRAHTQTLWVRASLDGFSGDGEGCPREYVTGESLEADLAFVHAHAQTWSRAIRDVESLRTWTQTQVALIDTHPAAWCAVEMALLDLFGKLRRQSLEALLGLPTLTGSFHYSAVLGDASEAAFKALLARYLSVGFGQFKVKLSGDSDRDHAKIRALREAGIRPAKVRADANNLWHQADTAAAYLEALDYPFWALEEPLQADDVNGMSALHQRTGMRIILDESLRRIEQLPQLATAPGQWILNMRVSKLGGVLRSLAMAQAARRHALPVIIGAHVGETSLLTRAALTVAAQARDSLLAQEGAVGTHLLERDVTTASLMFGKAGVLCVDDQSFPRRAGLGLDVREPA